MRNPTSEITASEKFVMGVSQHNGFTNWVVDQSAPIGESNCRKDITVTVILLDETVPGGVKYGPEIPATEGYIPRKIRFQQKTDNGSMPREVKQLRQEVQLAIGGDCPIKSNWHYVLAGNAASTSVATCRFKGPNKKKAIPQKLTKPVKDIAEYLARVEELPYDLWESGKFITAGFFDPLVLHDESARAWTRDKWFHSACEDFVECIKVLLASDQAKKLTQFTEAATLRVGHPKAQDIFKKVHNNTISDGSFHLYLAILQALAGVERKSEAGDSVMKQAEILYRNHMSTKNEKVINDLRKHKELRDQ
jgi:hypothetical protein